MSDRTELIQFIYESITRGSDSTFTEIGSAMVEGVLAKIKDNKFIATTLDPIFENFSSVDITPKIQSGIDNIILDMIKLVIDNVIMKEE